MDNVQQLVKDKLDLTPEEVIEYFKRHKIRCVACVVCFLIQFIAFYVIIKRAHWNQRGFVGKGFVFIQILVVLVLFEIARWCDVVLEIVSGSHGSVSAGEDEPSPNQQQNNSNTTPTDEQTDAKSPTQQHNSDTTPTEEANDEKSPTPSAVDTETDTPKSPPIEDAKGTDVGKALDEILDDESNESPADSPNS